MLMASIALEAWGARALNVTNLRAYERCGWRRLESHPAISRWTDPTGDDLQHPATRASQTLKCVIYSSAPVPDAQSAKDRVCS
jgi:hypothetical protein